METSAEFDPNEVARIVEDALRKDNVIHASFLDVTIMEKLSELLPGYLNEADVSYMFSKIRDDIYKSFKIPATSQLHKVISHCNKCAEEISVKPTATRWNVADPDLLIVGLNPTSVEPYQLTLVDALKSAGFKSDRCALSYVTRCPMDKVLPTCIGNCVGYLHTEVHALKPKLIISLGLEVYHAVTGDLAAKSKEVVGTIKWFGLYPVLHQNSLGYVNNLVQKNQGNLDHFNNIFKYAHKFIYSN